MRANDFRCVQHMFQPLGAAVEQYVIRLLETDLGKDGRKTFHCLKQTLQVILVNWAHQNIN